MREKLSAAPILLCLLGLALPALGERHCPLKCRPLSSPITFCGCAADASCVWVPARGTPAITANLASYGGIGLGSFPTPGCVDITY